MEQRFNMHCTNLTETIEYFRNRGIQLLMDGYILDKRYGVIPVVDDKGTEWGARAVFRSWRPQSGWGVGYDSVYVYDQFRGQGRFKKWLLSRPMNYMVTSPACGLKSFFEHVLTRDSDIFVVAAQFMLTKEYQAAERIFGHRKAARSDQWYMNHVDEGLFILNYLGASEKAKKAFCLHPVVQNDEELAKNFPQLSSCSDDPEVIALAMEYRSVANEYLAKRKLKGPERIRLSPLKDVNDMLIADKIQNYKDFLLYHKDTHENSDGLDHYFRNWFQKLGVSMKTFEFITKLITL